MPVPAIRNQPHGHHTNETDLPSLTETSDWTWALIGVGAICVIMFLTCIVWFLHNRNEQQLSELQKTTSDIKAYMMKKRLSSITGAGMSPLEKDSDETFYGYPATPVYSPNVGTAPKSNDVGSPNCGVSHAEIKSTQQPMLDDAGSPPHKSQVSFDDDHIHQINDIDRAYFGIVDDKRSPKPILSRSRSMSALTTDAKKDRGMELLDTATRPTNKEESTQKRNTGENNQIRGSREASPERKNTEHHSTTASRDEQLERTNVGRYPAIAKLSREESLERGNSGNHSVVGSRDALLDSRHSIYHSNESDVRSSLQTLISDVEHGQEISTEAVEDIGPSDFGRVAPKRVRLSLDGIDPVTRETIRRTSDFQHSLYDRKSSVDHPLGSIGEHTYAHSVSPSEARVHPSVYTVKDAQVDSGSYVSNVQLSPAEIRRKPRLVTAVADKKTNVHSGIHGSLTSLDFPNGSPASPDSVAGGGSKQSTGTNPVCEKEFQLLDSQCFFKGDAGKQYVNKGNCTTCRHEENFHQLNTNPSYVSNPHTGQTCTSCGKSDPAHTNMSTGCHPSIVPPLLDAMVENSGIGQPDFVTVIDTITEPIGHSGLGQPDSVTVIDTITRPSGHSSIGQPNVATVIDRITEPIGHSGLGKPNSVTVIDTVPRASGHSFIGQPNVSTVIDRMRSPIDHSGIGQANVTPVINRMSGAIGHSGWNNGPQDSMTGFDTRARPDSRPNLATVIDRSGHFGIGQSGVLGGVDRMTESSGYDGLGQPDSVTVLDTKRGPSAHAGIGQPNVVPLIDRMSGPFGHSGISQPDIVTVIDTISGPSVMQIDTGPQFTDRVMPQTHHTTISRDLISSPATTISNDEFDHGLPYLSCYERVSSQQTRHVDFNNRVSKLYESRQMNAEFSSKYHKVGQINDFDQMYGGTVGDTQSHKPTLVSRATSPPSDIASGVGGALSPLTDLLHDGAKLAHDKPYFEKINYTLSYIDNPAKPDVSPDSAISPAVCPAARHDISPSLSPVMSTVVSPRHSTVSANRDNMSRLGVTSENLTSIKESMRNSAGDTESHNEFPSGTTMKDEQQSDIATNQMPVTASSLVDRRESAGTMDHVTVPELGDRTNQMPPICLASVVDRRQSDIVSKLGDRTDEISMSRLASECDRSESGTTCRVAPLPLDNRTNQIRLPSVSERGESGIAGHVTSSSLDERTNQLPAARLESLLERSESNKIGHVTKSPLEVDTNQLSATRLPSVLDPRNSRADKNVTPSLLNDRANELATTPSTAESSKLRTVNFERLTAKGPKGSVTVQRITEEHP